MKRLFMCLICIITVMCLANCQRYVTKYDDIYVHIKPEYYDEFTNQDIKKEDFEFDDIEGIMYLHWSEKDNYGIIGVWFINTSTYKLKKFIKHCSNLDFVLEVEKMKKNDYSNRNYADNRIHIYIKPEYHEKFINEEIKIEDFEFDGIERIGYSSSWSETLNEGMMTIYLKEPTMKKVKKLIRHCRKLDFVKRAEIVPSGILYDPLEPRIKCSQNNK